MRKLAVFLFVLFSLPLWAQEQDTLKRYSLSLEEAIALGLENNYSARRSQKEIEKALKQKWEIISQGLPQLTGNVDYQNFLKQPVTLIPAEITGGEPGTFTPVRFGTKQSLNAAATWNQLFFDGSYIVGVQSVKTLLQLSKNAKIKTDIEVKKAIINAYGNVLLAEESVEILMQNLETVEKNFSDTQKIYENGLAEEEDVERLEITLLSLQNSLSRSERMRDLSYEMLNLALGLPNETEVTLTQELEELTLQYYDLSLLNRDIDVEETIDFRIAFNNTEYAKIQERLEKAKALPTLSGFVNYGYQGYSESFSFFNKDQDYFAQSILGISLNIPIFSSGMRSSRTAQRKIEYEQALLDLEQTQSEVKLEIATAKSDYEFSIENLETQKRSLALAERIEDKNQIKFFEGLASSFELSEAQTQLFQAQQDYLQAMLELINSKVELESFIDTNLDQNEN